MGGGGVKLIFLPANKHESFLQIGSITLGLHSQACPKYPKQVYNIFVYLKENVKDELDLSPTDKRQRFLQIAIIILGVCGQACQNYPNNKFAISLQYLKKELSDEVDFLHADNHESLLQIDSMILMGIVKHSQSSQNSKFAMSLQYLKKEGMLCYVYFILILHADKHSKSPKSLFQHFGHQS